MRTREERSLYEVPSSTRISARYGAVNVQVAAIIPEQKTSGNRFEGEEIEMKSVRSVMSESLVVKEEGRLIVDRSHARQQDTLPK